MVKLFLQLSVKQVGISKRSKAMQISCKKSEDWYSSWYPSTVQYWN